MKFLHSPPGNSTDSNLSATTDPASTENNGKFLLTSVGN